MTEDFDEEERTARLRQRLWGAAVLIAILVIVLPLVLDGSGSESQFRRVERLREEPPRVLGVDGQPEIAEPQPVEVTDAPESEAPRIRIGEDDPPDYLQDSPESGSSSGVDVTVTSGDELTAWVVQAGSFGDESNAIAVRDRLRRAGFPSFVSQSDDGRALFRVQVGPMIDAFRAQSTLEAVVALLGRDAIVVKYP